MVQCKVQCICCICICTTT